MNEHDRYLADSMTVFQRSKRCQSFLNSRLEHSYWLWQSKMFTCLDLKQLITYGIYLKIVPLVPLSMVTRNGRFTSGKPYCRYLRLIFFILRHACERIRNKNKATFLRFLHDSILKNATKRLIMIFIDL